AKVYWVASNDYHDWEFSYGPLTVLNITYSPNYEISWLFQTICMNSFAAYFSATDLITAAILVHISFQFKLLQNYIKEIVKVSYKEMLMDKCTPDFICYDDNDLCGEKEIDNTLIDWKYLKRTLKNAVEYHLAIISIVNELENMFRHRKHLQSLYRPLKNIIFVLDYAEVLFGLHGLTAREILKFATPK
ncbi:hypothetical protein ILUMI_07661, partial [Ignelater luminosus]